MKKRFRKGFLFVLVFISGWFGNIQNVQGQPSSVHDSLKHLLVNIQQQTKDESLKQAINEAQALYLSYTVDDSLAKKLLTVDSLLGKSYGLNLQVILPYAEILVKVLQQLSPQNEHPAYAKGLCYLARLNRISGKYEIAHTLLQQALAIIKKVQGEVDADYGTCLNDLAILYYYSGQYDKAEVNYEQAITVRAKVLGEEHPDYAASLNNLGILYEQMGKYEKALSLFEKAVAIRAKVLGDEHPDYAASLSSMALLYYHTLRYDKALPLYQQALAILKKTLGAEHREYAAGLNNLALLYQSMGQYEKAVSYYQQALTIIKKTLGAENLYYSACLNNLGMVYSLMGQYSDALPLYQQELAITKKIQGEGHADYSLSLNNLGDLYVHMKLFDTALIYYQQAISIVQKTLGEEHHLYVLHLDDLANLYSRMGNFDTALYLYQKEQTIIQKVFGTDHPDNVKGLNNLGLLYTALDNQTEAANLFMKASSVQLKHLTRTYTTLSEQEKMTYLNKEYFQFSYLPSVLFHQGIHQPAHVRQVYAHELLLKGMVLEDQQGVFNSIRKSSDSTAFQLYQQWRANKTYIGEQLLLPIAGRVRHLDSLEEVTTQLEQQLSRRTAAFSHQLHSQSLTTKDIAYQLLQGQAAIEFIQFRLYNKSWTDSILYAAMILLPGDSAVHFTVLCEEKQLLRYTRSSFALASGKFNDSLYQLIWKPLEKHLKGIHTVYLAPTGLLHRIAFQALRSDATHLLIDKLQLYQVLSSRSVVLPAEVHSKPSSASIWGDIDYSISYSTDSRQASRGADDMDTAAFSFHLYTPDSNYFRGGELPALPGTKQEISNLKQVFERAHIFISVNSGALATEEAFKALDGKSPQVMHLATHGFFLPMPDHKLKDTFDADHGAFTAQENPMFRSGLALAGANYAWKGNPAIPNKEDGILTAYEIAQMDLSGTDLVVLSACETALGDLQGDEGVIGLQRALKMAGVKQMIISLWQVPDKVTSELMILFYKNWLNGQTTREALRKAQLKIKEKYPSPFFWAAFVLVE